MPICDECGTVWKPNGRRFEEVMEILCTECYIKREKKRAGFNGM